MAIEASTRASSPRSAFHAPSQISHRHARSSTSASASIHWIAWRWLSFWPNVSRCLACSMAMRCAATATPRFVAEYGNRFLTSRSKASSSPCPSLPMRASAGSSQSSNTTSLGIAAVRSVRMFFQEKPGVPGSRMKQEMPPRPFSLLVRAKTMPHFPLCALEMKTLRPLSTHRSPRRSARVWMAPAGSEPPDGSVIAKNVRQPSRIVGSAYFLICSWLPAQIAGGG